MYSYLSIIVSLTILSYVLNYIIGDSINIIANYIRNLDVIYWNRILWFLIGYVWATLNMIYRKIKLTKFKIKYEHPTEENIKKTE